VCLILAFLDTFILSRRGFSTRKNVAYIACFFGAGGYMIARTFITKRIPWYLVIYLLTWGSLAYVFFSHTP
jgi:hypothetical protein